mgnify:CR=1 FL=1
MAGKENLMREVRIEKLILSCGGVKEELDKGMKLLQKISKKKPVKKMTYKRIPTFGIRPQLEVGGMVTLRGEEAIALLKRLLAAVENRLRKKQIQENFFSLGLEEYIEIPGEEYDRDIGMRGFNVTVVFSRKGRRVTIKRIKKGKLPKKQHISKQEIINFMEEKFNTSIK